MPRAKRVGTGVLTIGLLLLLGGLALFASPWYVDGGLIARLYGYTPSPGESNWLSVLAGTGASFAAGLITSAAGLLCTGLGLGGLLASRRPTGTPPE